MAKSDAGSSKGRTGDFESPNLGSSPSPAASAAKRQELVARLRDAATAPYLERPEAEAMREAADALDAIAKLCQVADELHADFVFVPHIDAILGTSYGRWL